MNSFHIIRKCFSKAFNAKSSQKIEIAKALIRRAFSPIVNQTKLLNGRKPWGTVRKLIERELRSPQDQAPEYHTLVSKVQSSFIDDSFDKTKPYSYIFVRQDIKPEQQLVQTAHCTMVLGSKLSHLDCSKIHFVIMGCKDLNELRKRMNFMVERDIRFEVFAEPDINNEPTAIASYPITSIAERKKFARFKLLKFADINTTSDIHRSSKGRALSSEDSDVSSNLAL